MFTYFNKKSAEIAKQENRYDVMNNGENSSPAKFSSFFLRKMREVIFCRNHNLPTKEKEKTLRAYRDFAVKDK